jgi:hypothetical protein
MSLRQFRADPFGGLRAGRNVRPTRRARRRPLAIYGCGGVAFFYGSHVARASRPCVRRSTWKIARMAETAMPRGCRTQKKATPATYYRQHPAPRPGQLHGKLPEKFTVAALSRTRRAKV